MKQRNFLESFQFDNGAILKNRIVMAPMTTSASFYDGQVTNDEIEYYRLRASGPGMVITAVANVTEDGKGFEGQMGIHHDRYIPRLQKIANAIKINDTKAIIQIFHAGRMTNSAILRGTTPLSASAIPSPREGAETPNELSEAQIELVIQGFEAATLRAIKAGFDGIELHGANTYLIQQFMSPHSNRRMDEWGGSLANRMRFPLTIINRVQNVIDEHAPKSFLLGYRISPEEYEEPGIRMFETLEFVKALKQSGIDYLHLSLSNVWQKPAMEAENNHSISEQIHKIIGDDLPLITVGDIKSPDDAEAVIASGIPLVAMGKTFIREPKWVQKVERNDEESIRYSISKRDYEELAIPAAMASMLEVVFKDIMGFTTE